jgi:hypothetical protein
MLSVMTNAGEITVNPAHVVCAYELGTGMAVEFSSGLKYILPREDWVQLRARVEGRSN